MFQSSRLAILTLFAFAFLGGVLVLTDPGRADDDKDRKEQARRTVLGAFSRTSNGGDNAKEVQILYGDAGTSDESIRIAMKYRDELRSLKSWTMNKSRITDAGIKEIHGLPNLVALYLSQNRITDVGVAGIKDV